MEILRAEGIDVSGPWPADTMFTPDARATYDVAVCMYHDQALIPIKTLDMTHGVNVTLGLPIIRTSPDHGTAFGIAGRDRADPSSLIAALDLAAALARDQGKRTMIAPRPRPRRALPPLRLGVNIDHVATIRNARGGVHPDPLAAAQVAVAAGADGITLHLREDRRHIRDDDVARIRETIIAPINFEMAATEEMLRIALATKPNACCIVPERRAEVTTEGGLDVAGQHNTLRPIVAALRGAGIRVSMFIDPDPAQLQASAAIEARPSWSCTPAPMPRSGPARSSGCAGPPPWRCRWGWSAMRVTG